LIHNLYNDTYIAAEWSVNGCEIYNNVLYGFMTGATSGYGIKTGTVAEAVTNITIKNNIAMDVYTTQTAIEDKNSITACDYNCWYQSGAGGTAYTTVNGTSYTSGQFAAYKSATGFDTHGKWESPLFVSTTNYHLQATSPCRDTGISVGISLDFEGNAVPYGGAPDMGAYEYQGGAGEPEINITDGVNTIIDGRTFTFATTVINKTIDQEFTIENLGGANLTLSGTPIITITGADASQFSVVSQPTTPITPGNHVYFTLRFSPTSIGTKVALITITNNDVDEGTYDINLAGTGKAAGITPGRKVTIKVNRNPEIK
jgi:hypothetical protein